MGGRGWMTKDEANLIGTVALSIIAWQLYVFIEGDVLRSYYNFGDSTAKWLVISFLEPFVVMIAVPLVIVTLISLLVGSKKARGRTARAYRHGLVAAAVWMAVASFGLWYGRTPG